MKSEKEIEWKIAGLLPVPIGDNSKYYLKYRDENYSKRTFGRKEIEVPAFSLKPTKLFHQALGAELRKTYDTSIVTTRLPYSLQIGDLGVIDIRIRLRVIAERFLIISIKLPKILTDQSVGEIIEFQKLSSHPILESIGRFCFNVDYCPNPSRLLVEAWNSMPFLRITPIDYEMPISMLVEIVTRHNGINERATREMIDKNKSLNFNDDLMLIDKQGVVFLLTTQDHNNQRNRYQRISSLLEYSLYVKSSTDSISLFTKCSKEIAEISPGIEVINKVLSTDILGESVSANRGWMLLKQEMCLNEIPLEFSASEAEPFYKKKWFLGLSALIVLISGVIKIADFFNSGE